MSEVVNVRGGECRILLKGVLNVGEVNLLQSFVREGRVQVL